MRLLYTTSIRLYTLGIRTASLFNTKARQMCQGWRRTYTTTPLRRGTTEQKTAWFHASSMGEFEQARPVIEQLRAHHPEYRIWVTFFSPSGYEIRKNYPLADRVTYLPMDTPRNARRTVELIRPDVVFFVKYDFWFNLLAELHRRQVPTYIFSAIFRPRQYFFRWYGGWFRKQLNTFAHIFVQNQASIELLTSHHIERCSIAGDTRFDRVNAIADSAKQYAEIATFIDGKPVLMAGSSWEPDERHIAHFMADYKPPLKAILAPHVIDESHLQSIENLFAQHHCLRYSQLKAMTPQQQQTAATDHKVLIIDNIGMLSSLYQYATVAYIGGGWGKGIHNILEALTFGKPVVFGPNWHKFQEASETLSRQGTRTYSHYDELANCLSEWLDNPVAYRKASTICRQYVEENLGASSKVLNTAQL